jgi:glycosyltransferase involved in cell wall biosynthesis
MSHKKQIHHCNSGYPHTGGGITTYIQSLLIGQGKNVSNHVLTSLTDIDQSHCKLLHVHCSFLLEELTGECPIVYTLHNHSPYCPSGRKYFSSWEKNCNRNMSYLGCISSHIIDGCGSRRPTRIVQNIRSSFKEFHTLRRLKILVAANSNYVREQLISNGFPPKQVVTIRLGMQMPQKSSGILTQSIHRQQRILFVGRITPEKGLDWLLQALKLSNRKICLDIAGDGWARLDMEKLAEKLGISDRITWHGWCNSNKLDALYQRVWQ